MIAALYNEIDPFAVRWLRNLITAGHIAPGVVNERSIADLVSADVAGLGQRHFFAGIAGWSRALRLAGVPDDASVWTGSCPCQSLSDAGKRRGFDDERHLWPEWFRLIRECRPPVVLGEQVASGLGWSWLDLVFADLEGAGYTCAAANLPAASVGAPHRRQRVLFVAYTDREQGRLLAAQRKPGRVNAETRRRCEAGDMADGDITGLEVVSEQQTRRQLEATERGSHDGWSDCDWIPCFDGVSRPVESGTHPLAHGVPGRVGLLRGYGNAIVPEAVAAFIIAALESA